MAKRKGTSGGEGEGAGQDPPPRRRPPSRDKVRYVALPLDLYLVLEKYAQGRSDEDDKKSVSWAARVAVRRFLTGEGLLPRPGEKPKG